MSRSWFWHSIKGKFFTILAMIALVVLSSTLYSLWGLYKSSNGVRSIVQENVPRLKLGNQLRKHTLETLNNVTALGQSETYQKFNVLKNSVNHHWEMLLQTVDKFDDVGLSKEKEDFKLYSYSLRKDLDELIQITVHLLKTNKQIAEIRSLLLNLVNKLDQELENIKSESGLELGYAFIDLAQARSIDKDEFDEILNGEYKYFQYSMEMTITLTRLRNHLNAALLETSHEKIINNRKKFTRVNKQVNRYLKSLPKGRQAAQIKAQLEDLVQFSSGPGGLYDLLLHRLDLGADSKNNLTGINKIATSLTNFSIRLPSSILASTTQVTKKTEESLEKHIWVSLILLGGSVVALIFIGGGVIVKQVIRPILETADAMEDIVQGHDIRKFPEAGTYEIDQMVSSLSTLKDFVDRVTSAERDRAEALDHLQLALDNMSDGMFMIDADGNYNLHNHRYRELVELPEGVIHRGLPIKEAIRCHAQRGDYGKGDIEEIVRTRLHGLTNDEYISRELLIDNRRTVDIRKAPLKEGGAVVIISDITERKEQERKLAETFSLIKESIAYSSRIQRGLLPQVHVFSEFFKEHYIYWEPKDVVGGDLYLHRKTGMGDVVLVGDCTGHGVPGAVMTTIATGAFEIALAETPFSEPEMLLKRMNQRIKTVLHQIDKDGENDDGIEAAICLFEPESIKMQFAGARFPLFLMRDGEISEIKGDKRGLGYRRTDMSQNFTRHEIDIEDAVCILASDGVFDQVGGKKRVGFGKRRFKAALLEHASKPVEELGESLLEVYLAHQGDSKRRDDVTLLMFKAQ